MLTEADEYASCVHRRGACESWERRSHANIYKYQNSGLSKPHLLFTNLWGQHPGRGSVYVPKNSKINQLEALVPVETRKYREHMLWHCPATVSGATSQHDSVQALCYGRGGGGGTKPRYLTGAGG